MAEADRDGMREISLGADFGAVVIKANGATVEISADGHVAASSSTGHGARTSFNASRSPDTHKPRLYRCPTPGHSAEEFGRRMDFAIEGKIKEAVRYTRWLMGE